ncbi:MAG: acetylglucosamine-6-sulfatase [Verrucomicrobiales bacterium]|nr:acetylglucosamine-6-sulfatase [Verrucomicrobiales bacterium]|tara:strand:+ start:8326 stop:9819 length:1494 start_codon:yes stop_codon:yes gene_type:complete
MKSRIPFLVVFLAASVALLAKDRKPNIVFLLADDQTFYSMGCYGNRDVKTPNMDRLARDGMIFDNHYDTTAICMASRANIMTGMFEYKAGCNFEHGDMRDSVWKKTYPMLLREAGYQTAFAGKFGFVVSRAGQRRGVLPEDDFDRWGGGPGQTSYATAKNKSMAKYAKEYPHATRSYGAFGADFIRDASKGDKPFCLSISFKAPHRPTTPDPAFDHVYAGKKFTKPKNYGRQRGEHFALQSRQGRQYERFTSWGYSDRYDEVMAIYHQQIYAIDVALGMIRKALKTHGVADNTVVIYTSDNGFLCGSHGYGSKVLPYEEASRVPLIVFDPRHQNSGKKLRCRALTGNVDFAPTMLELAGVSVPKNMDGRSLLPLLDDPGADIHESLPLINVWGPKEVHSLSVVTKDWKYIFWNFAGDGFEETEELYHTANDGLELENLAGNSDHYKQLVQMQKVYDAYVTDWKENGADYNNYEKFGTIFDRSVGWSKKQELVGKRRK